MRVISPQLFGTAQIDFTNSAGVTSQELDFSVRAPIGIMLNGAKFHIAVNADAASMGLYLATAIAREPDHPPPAGPDAWPGLTSGADLNTDVLAWHAWATISPNNTVTGINAMILGASDWMDYTNLPPEARPMSTRPMRFAVRQEVDTGFSAQLGGAGCFFAYQVVELTNDEVAALAAST